MFFFLFFLFLSYNVSIDTCWWVFIQSAVMYVLGEKGGERERERERDLTMDEEEKFILQIKNILLAV